MKPIAQVEWERLVENALEPVANDNPYMSIREGDISAIEAMNHSMGSFGLDVRPKILDKQSNSWILLDSGSAVSCIPKKKEDVMDQSLRLRAVNGNIIPTFGTEMLKIQVGRKSYEIEAVKIDIQQKILGWDWFRKYKLGLEWNEFGDILLVDKKAGIKTTLEFVRIPADSIPRVSQVDSYQEPIFHQNYESILFQTSCMKALDGGLEVNAMSIHPDQAGPMCDNIPLKVDPDSNLEDEENMKALEKMSGPYADLVKKYPSILKTEFKKVPTTDIYHRIETTGEPFKSRVRPLLANSEKSKEGRKIWSEMEKLGVIERVKPQIRTQYTSPLHLVPKPNNRGFRVCGDFRLLNQQTKNDNYPLPLLRSFQAKIKNSKVFSTIDVKSAFHHLPIHEDDVNKTCVLSPWGGAYVFKRLAFGLTNGPSSWQKYIDTVLAGIDGIFCYLDDILLCTEDVDSHLSLVETVFQRLQANGIAIALNKCTFAKESIPYLGYQVSSSGIRPLNRKVDAIQRIPPPTTQKELLQFLGALNYFRSSLSGLKKEGRYHNAANLLQPLYAAATTVLPSKNKFLEVWNHSPVLKNAFQDAKKLLMQAAELAHPDPSLPLALMTDASQHSVGACLMQLTKGKWVPLGYMSRHLSVDKANWSTCRKELLAAQAGVRYFISEIYGRHCTIYSDHAPLVLAFKNPQGFQLHDPVAQRALMEIGQFTNDIRHISGVNNAGSDFLSRIKPDLKGSEVAALEGLKLYSVSPQVVFEAQQECKELELIKQGLHPSSVTFKSVNFGDVDLWCEMSLSNPRPVLPKSMRKFVMQQLHSLAHDGIKESVRKISSYYFWKDMKKEITEFCQTCHGCQSVKASTTKSPHYGFFDVPDTRFKHCHVDIVGPLPESGGCKYMLTIQDRTTRQLTVIPLPEPSAKTCSRAFLLHYIALYGVPSACTSDQGSNFVSALFQEMQQGLGIDIKHTPIYWPQSNGLIERSHRSLKTSIRAQLIELGQKYQDKWIDLLPWALLGRRTAFNKNLGTSSNELVLGMHVQVPGACVQDINLEDEPLIEDILNKLQIKNNRVAVPTAVNPQTEVETPPESVTHVYTRQHDVKGLQPKYCGPFLVLSRPSRSTLEIKVGLNKDGSFRKELRTWSDVKPAYLRENMSEASRPKRGRPSKPTSDSLSNSKSSVDASLPKSNQNNVGTNNSKSPNSNAAVAAIDFSVPPPMERAGNSNAVATHAEPKAWSASQQDIEWLNKSISRLPASANTG